MTDLKISQFTNGGAVQATDEIATNRSGVNTKVFVGTMAAEDAADYTPTANLGTYAFADTGDALEAPSVEATTSAGLTLKNSAGTDVLTVGSANTTNATFAGALNITGKANTAASTTGGAGLNIAPGTAPTTPMNGDIWTTSTGVFARVNGVTQKLDDSAVSMPGLISGLTTSNNAVDATNDIDIAAGSAAADTSPFILMTLGSALTKRLDAAWAVGSGNGGLDTGSIANGTYHIWLIQRSDTGVVDALFSTSATSPTMPANYDRKRRIASIVRSAGAILAYRQNGDEFEWVTPVADIDVTTPGTAAVTRALTVPTGIGVKATIVCLLSNAAATNSHRFSALDTTDVVPGTGAGNAGQLRGTASTQTAGQIEVRTNTSGQIRSRNETAGADIIRCATWGWVDITRSA